MYSVDMRMSTYHLYLEGQMPRLVADAPTYKCGGVNI